MSTDSDHPLCPACAQGQAMIERIARLSKSRPLSEKAVIDTMPLLLETILSNLHAEYDFEANTGTKTAGAIIMLAMAAERAQVLYDAQSARMLAGAATRKSRKKNTRSTKASTLL